MVSFARSSKTTGSSATAKTMAIAREQIAALKEKEKEKEGGNQSQESGMALSAKEKQAVASVIENNGASSSVGHQGQSILPIDEDLQEAEDFVLDPIVFAAPPNPVTQAILDQLVSDVAYLKSELSSAHARIEELESVPPFNREIERLDRSIASLHQLCDSHFETPDELMTALRKLVDESHRDVRREIEMEIARVELDFDRNLRHVEETADKDEDRVNAQMESARADREKIEGRMMDIAKALEKRVEKLELAGQARQAEEADDQDASHQASTSKQAAVDPASPTLSDAPPTRSLVSFDSPIPSPASRQQRSTPIAAHAFAPTITHQSTPFKLAASASSSKMPPLAATPVSALPPHMLASASSRRSPRNSTVQTESPAAPTPNALLGKRSRGSTASDTSIGVEAVVSPPKMQLPVYPSVLGGPASLNKEDGHSRKRLRMSSAADEEDVARAAEQEEDQLVDSLSKSVSAPEASFDEEEEEESEHEDSNDSVRDYLMPTKTGDSPAFTLRPLNPDPNCNALSTSDPSFFAAPISPSRSTPGRRSTANENARPTTADGPRKSLPLSSLPFPLVSPFASKTRPFGFGTPATTALGNVSNKHQTTSKSASRASTQRLPPMTPPASRTLFGTERFPFSDGEEMIGNDEGKERFEDDGFQTAEEDNTGNWSRFGGAFSRV